MLNHLERQQNNKLSWTDSNPMRLILLTAPKLVKSELMEAVSRRVVSSPTQDSPIFLHTRRASSRTDWKASKKLVLQPIYNQSCKRL